MKYADRVSPKLSYRVKGVFSQHNKIRPFILFHWVFERIYMTIGHQLSSGSVKNQITTL
jgi:hypothetical protein